MDLWRKRASSDEWVEKLCDIILHWKPQAIAQETGQIRAGIGPFLTRRMRQRRAYAYTEVFPTRGNKSVRAQSIRGRMALEGLHVPTDAPWYPAFRSELLSFPAGRHDDASMRWGSLASSSTRWRMASRSRLKRKSRIDWPT